MARRGENIYLRKDGRYEGRYLIAHTIDKKPIWGYIYGRQYYAVRKRLIQKKAEISYQPAESHRFGKGLYGEWAEYWLQARVATGIRPSSLDCYQSTLKNHLLPRFGMMNISSINREEIQRMLDELQLAGLSASTRKNTLRLLRASLEAAKEYRLISANPCSSILHKSDKRPKARVLTASEQKKLTQDALDRQDLSTLIALYSGLRVGEVCALNWEDVDWCDNSLHVSRTAQRIRNAVCSSSVYKTRLVVETAKTEHSVRTVPLPMFVMKFLRKRYQENDVRGGYIFGSQTMPADPRKFQNQCAATAKRLKLRGVHYHTFRHSYATRLLERGVDIKTVSDLLGHSSAQTTLTYYAHSTPEQQRRAAALLDNLA